MFFASLHTLNVGMCWLYAAFAATVNQPRVRQWTKHGVPIYAGHLWCQSRGSRQSACLHVFQYRHKGDQGWSWHPSFLYPMHRSTCVNVVRSSIKQAMAVCPCCSHEIPVCKPEWLHLAFCALIRLCEVFKWFGQLTLYCLHLMSSDVGELTRCA